MAGNNISNVEKRFDEKEGILYIKATGDLKIEYMLNGIELLSNSDFLPRQLKIFEDSRESKAVFSLDELKLITYKLGLLADKYISIRHAVIHLDPINTAYAMLLNENNKNKKYILKVFSTAEAATIWLNL